MHFFFSKQLRKQKKVSDVNIEGQIVVLSGTPRTLFGFGGPGINIKFRSHIVRPSFYPSLSFPYKKTEDQYQVSFSLAFGVEYTHRKLKRFSLLLAWAPKSEVEKLYQNFLGGVGDKTKVKPRNN